MTDTIRENLTSQVDGIAVTFTTGQAFIAGSLSVDLNGQTLTPGVDYDEDPGLTSFTMVATCLPAPIVGDQLLVQYEIVGVGGGGGSICVKDEGVTIGDFDCIDFKGAEVTAIDGGGGTACIFIPPLDFLSHWNTDDGSNGAQFVSEDITRTVTRISTPAGGEGTPFSTNGWAGTNQFTHLDPGDVNFTTPGDTTGFGGDSTMTITMYDADGTTIIEQFTTPALTGNGVYASGNITVTLTNYGADASRFKAHANVAVDVGAAFTGIGREGGRYHITATHTTDSATDGNGPFTYTQSDVFLDFNPTTPAINGTVSIAETPGFVVTKFLSGIEYYTLGSQFTLDVTDIDDHNEHTSRTADSFTAIGTEYGLPTLNHSPFGTGAANFIGWTNDHDQDDVDYHIENWTITATNYRYMGPTGNVSARPRDPWNIGSTINSPNSPILIDTYGIHSTDTFDDFVDEARRETSDFSGAGLWDSTLDLVAGEALVFNDQLMSPQSSTLVRSDGPNDPNTDWTSYNPSGNPDYTGLIVPAKYQRRFTRTPGINTPSFTFVFTGTFAAGNMLADLQTSPTRNVEIYIYRIAIPGGTPGQFGPPPGNTRPLRVHEPFNFAVYDDGLTVPGSGVRLGSSSGNTIQVTFGTGTPADTGFYCCIVINNPATRINSVNVTFN